MGTIRLLAKATTLIEHLAEVGTATPAEIARDMDEPRPSVYRIVASLEDAGYVRSAGGGRLELGSALLRLGDAAVSAVVDRAGLQEVLRHLRDQLGMAAFFGVRRGAGDFCLDRIGGSDVDLHFLSPGREFPGAGGAASAVLSDAGAVYRILGDGGLGAGIASAAAPVHDPDGGLLGVVGVAGLADRLAAQGDILQDVLGAAADTVTCLGASVPAGSVGGDVPPEGEVADSRNPSVVAKAVALLSVLERDRVATSAQLAEVLGEPASSVYRMLGTLAEVGWVEQVGARGPYRTGLRLLDIAERLLQRRDIRVVAAPVMREIHELTGETIFLCIRHSGSAVCIERIDGIRVNSRVLQLGMSMPLHVGAAPRALLAFSGRQAWEDYASVVEARGDRWHGVASRAEFFRELEQARTAGYVVSDDDVTPGIAAVGVPVHNHRGEVVASLSVSGLRDGILGAEVPGSGGRTVTDLVTEGGRRISVALGATCPDADAV